MNFNASTWYQADKSSVYKHRETLQSKVTSEGDKTNVEMPKAAYPCLSKILLGNNFCHP